MRAGMRLVRLALHLVYGCLLSASLLCCMGPHRCAAARHDWAEQLLPLLGVRLEMSGRPSCGTLWVANHISWLDVFLLLALQPAVFVCKDEVRRWPLFGWLLARNDVLFLRRGSAAAVAGLVAGVARLLGDSHTVVIFPEGTSSDGSRVLPFHAAPFEAAVKSGRAVQPVAIAYVDIDGMPTSLPAYHGDVSLWRSLVGVASATQLRAQVNFLLPLECAERRDLAQRAQQAIAAQLAQRAGRGHAAVAAPARTTDGVAASGV